MCLILFGYRAHTRYRMVLAANRDEFYDRPAAPMDFWEDHNHILAGRDLKMMGTWFGITRTGRMAAITNYRQPEAQLNNAPSRGHLISDFLKGHENPADYLRDVAARSDRYNGFNLLVGDTRTLFYYSNRAEAPIELSSGIYGLSNHLIDTRWPKVSRGKERLTTLMKNEGDLNPNALLDLLQNQTLPPDDQLPDTGVGQKWERLLSPMFITSPSYGTRASTVLTIDQANRVEVTEITWQQGLTPPKAIDQQTYRFAIEPE